MQSYYLDWANLLLRWLHVITAIAWIGASFYFVFLDTSLVPPRSRTLLDQGVGGELWALHGGGFYNSQKYAVAPPVLPERLHWFYWEAYSTWLSGFALFAVSYLWNPGTYLVDPSLVAWTGPQAVGLALAFLAVFWFVYDLICRGLGRGRHGDAIVGALVLLVVCFASWLACQWFAGRAAFLLLGAMLGTAMSANVLVWIIPGQRITVRELREGRAVDPVHGERARQRSVHNTYFTLPVLFAMLSNHYSFVYSAAHNWLVLVLMMLAGASVRQFFVLRHGFLLGRGRHPWPYALIGVLLIAGVVVWMRPAMERPDAAAVSPAPASAAQAAAESAAAAGGAAASAASAGAASAGGASAGGASAGGASAGGASAGAALSPEVQAVQQVVAQRCVVCHGPTLQMKNIRLDSMAYLKQHAQEVYQQAVVTRVMPMNNATRITDDERAVIARWFLAGAKTQ